MRIKRTTFFALTMVLFPVCYLLRNISLLSYYDEIVGAISTIYVFYLFVSKKLYKNDYLICMLLMLITITGLISNLCSGLIDNWFAIVVDALWLWKTFSCYIAFKYIALKRNKREYILRALSWPSQLSIIIVFCCSIIGQVIDIGVTSDYILFGLKQFVFWGNSLQTGWLLFCSLMILAATEKNKKIFRRYYIMSLIPAFLTFSSLVYCYFFIASVLITLLHKDAVFKKRYIVFLAAGIALFTFADIGNYLFSDSVRTKLIIGGIKVANKYFPLGSGFATYGSEMATRYYSKIYVGFGWENTWGLGKNYSQYLNDNFFASIIGQFGWIGFMLYGLALYLLFKEANTHILTHRERCLTVATVLTMAAVMIGSASVKSIMGVCTFAILGIVTAKNYLSCDYNL